jgi:hypothetical protein
MQQHFNFKSLIFYAIAISSVLVLFKTVTAYGEKNLKPPPQINTRYLLLLEEKLPACSQLEPLSLNIHQSGIYLNGFLSPANAHTPKNSAANEINPFLNGKYQNQTVNLSGHAPVSALCDRAPLSQKTNSNHQNFSTYPVRLNMKLAQQNHLTGQITVSGFSQTIAFTAQVAPTAKESEK